MPAALEISNLQKTYANGFQALKGIDLKVEEGDFYALLGPNGAGKSTTIGIVSSLVSKSGGSVKICGIDIDEDFSLAKKQIGIVPQEFNFNVFEKVEDVLIHQAGYYGIPIGLARQRAEYYLEKLGIADKATRSDAHVVRWNEAPFDDCSRASARAPCADLGRTYCRC